MSQMIAQEQIVTITTVREDDIFVRPASRTKQAGKRLFDIVFSLLVILTIFPLLFPVIWLLIRLDSKGGAFFVQRRNGLNNKVFLCLKFRTMVLNDSSDTIAAEDDDERITRIGRILRNSGLDELPQFLNVLMGQMSIVGPRPHMINDNLKFALLSERYHIRTMVRPGITGLAQVKGYKGNTSNPYNLRKRTAIDLIYVENHSVLLDIKIIAATIGMMCVELFKIARK